MRSFKGVVFGSEEYVTKFKAEEVDYEVNQILARMEKDAKRLVEISEDLTQTQIKSLRRVDHYVGEMAEGW